jgi:2-methylaconitate cis-trans-isomerase PrpF
MGKRTRRAAGLFRRPCEHLLLRLLDWIRPDASGNKSWSVGSLTIHMAIMRSMAKVTNVNVWNHVRMRVRRAALAVIAGAAVGCTAHSIPSTALAELPVARFAALAVNSDGTLLPDARTDGGMLLLDDPNRAVRLANFDLSDPVERGAARPRDLAAPIGAPAGIVRFRRSGSE